MLFPYNELRNYYCNWRHHKFKMSIEMKTVLRNDFPQAPASVLRPTCNVKILTLLD